MDVLSYFLVACFDAYGEVSISSSTTLGFACKRYCTTEIVDLYNRDGFRIEYQQSPSGYRRVFSVLSAMFSDSTLSDLLRALAATNVGPMA